MDNYLLNLKLWYLGFKRFGELQFKPGWSADSLRWKALYATDYLACVLLGGPVVSISGYLVRWGFSGSHFIEAGPPLWGSVRSAPWIRIAAPIFWLFLIRMVL